MSFFNLKRSQIDKNIELKKLIIDFLESNKLNLCWVSNFKQIIYHYVNNMTEVPKCYCGKENNFKSTKIGYRKTCSPKCSNSSSQKKIKTRKVKLEKYGDENYNNSNKMMMTKTEKYGSKSFNNREKATLTNLDRYGFNTPMKNKKVIERGKETKSKLYGNSNYNNVEKIKEFWSNVEKEYIQKMIEKVKIKKLESHGDENYNNVEKMIKTKYEKYGHYYVNSNKANDTKKEKGLIFFDKIEFALYSKKVKSLTKSNKKLLYEKWNGYDYYDGEFIKGYQSLSHTHRFYPTIDHKISVWFGFHNGISPEEISDLSNLCITKRYINSTKSKMIEEQFKENPL